MLRGRRRPEPRGRHGCGGHGRATGAGRPPEAAAGHAPMAGGRRIGRGGHSGATGAGRPHQHVRFSCSYSVPGTSSACFVQQTPIGRHQESHCGGEAPSRLAKPLVSFCSSREFPRVARLPLRRMSTYRSLLRKSKVFGNQMRVQVAIRWGVLRQGRRLLKKLANNDAPNGGLGMLDGAAPAPVGCFAFWLSGKSLMGSGIVR